MSADWLDDEGTRDVLDEAAVMFLAVTGRRGPHVTPIAFDRDGDDLWALMPRDSSKARAIRRDNRVGVLVRHRGRTVIAGGTADLVDPLTGRGLGTLLRPDLPLTAFSYLARNRRRVVGTVLDDPSPGLPLSRTGVRITLDRVARVGRTEVAGWGSWPAPSTLLTGTLEPSPPNLAGVPEHLHALLTAPGAGAVLGWHTCAGPVALPATWDPAGSITLPAAALTLTGALSTGPACLTVERSRQRISSVRGLLLAGTGRARVEGDEATVSLEAQRVTWWSGEESGTVTRPVSSTA